MSRRNIVRIGLCALIVAAVIATSMYRVPTTFSMDVTTQVLQLTTADSFPWYFENATIQLGDDVEQGFSGSLMVEPGTKVTLERIGEGPLRIDCRARVKGDVVATITKAGDDQSRAIKDGLNLVVEYETSADRPKGHLVLLPVSGYMDVGAEVVEDMGNRPVLMVAGKVSLLAHTIVGKKRYDAGSAEFELGDYPRVEQIGAAHGLIVLGPEENIRAIYRVIARELRVSRFGSQGYEVYASPLDRMANDHGLQAIWAASLVLLGWLAKWGPLAKWAAARK